MLDETQGHKLLQLARAAVSDAAGAPPIPEPALEDWMRKPGACFVTLRNGTELRGCLGTIEPYRALYDDVRTNARAAATRDPRFPAIYRAELDDVRIEVSVLTPIEKLEFDGTEADALAKITPGVDGLVIRRGGMRGTLLPQVWEDLPDPREFLIMLKRKAGLPPFFWDDSVELYRYRVQHFHEPGYARESAA